MKTLLDTIERVPVIPVYYHNDPKECRSVLKACYEGGLRVFEFTDRGDAAIENFKDLVQFKSEFLPEMRLGIGTIKTAPRAQEFLDLGAEFVVSPLMNPDIATGTLDKGTLWVPGCMTVSEIGMAERMGAPLVKLFPGDTLGPGFVKSMKPIFPGMKFMPTGGVRVEQDSVTSWFDAGVTAIGLGSQLFQQPAGAEGNDWLRERVKSILSWVKK